MNKQITLLLLILFTACNSLKQNSTIINFTPDYSPGTHIIIYKTKKDYSQNLPVLYDEKKQKITKLFSNKELMANGNILYPIPLQKGYWLDRIGIDTTVAYVSFSIQKYTQSMMPITANMLKSKIIDKNPLLEMYDCGKIKGDTIKIINEIIKNGMLKKCKRLK